MINPTSVSKQKSLEKGAASKVNKSSHISFEKELRGVGLMGEAFSAFTDAAESLEKHYGHLEKKVAKLSSELVDKSSALERSLDEVSRMERYQANILKSLPSGVIVLDEAGKVKSFNRRAGDITGCRNCDAMGKKIAECFDLTFSLSSCNLSPIEKEVLFVRESGEKIYIKASISPFLDDRGKRDGTICILHDITREKILEKSLERGKRLTAMGEMAAKLAHEIRNPLGGIELLASNLKKNLKGNLWGRNMAVNICSGVASLNHVVTNVLQFARVEKPEMTEICLSDIIDSALLSSLHTIEEAGVEIRKDFRLYSSSVMGNRQMLKQAFLNIILNSVQAMNKGGRLDICIDCKDKDKVEIIFKDTGNGMSPTVKKSVFEPFYSTKGNGSGLGLAIVHNIIDSHGGSIELESEEGKGTSVAVTLPAKN